MNLVYNMRVSVYAILISSSLVSMRFVYAQQKKSATLKVGAATAFVQHLLFVSLHDELMCIYLI